MLGIFRRLMPREDSFFELFSRHSETLVAGAGSLRALLEGGDAVPKHCAEIVRQEDLADDIAREVLLAVNRSFITPFDRSDITGLIQAMDDAIDQMNQTVKAVTLYELRTFDPLMREMGDTVVEAAQLTRQAIPLLSAVGKNAEALGRLTEQIVKVEGRSDDLHDQGVKQLFREVGRSDPMAYIIGREIYGDLEDVVDKFEDVANTISAIVVENV
ncbi:DUF47 domain-containing protein [Chelatococcus sambhunathii]|uniref:DUF47 domain-containing protein n=1 Tax=Chelatococcus sambhunathii TaxID=363953 RepID=A0ABU1DEB6_9HYPH|nr:DUF47 domain-containing protein [Chelatococcus sambhunathii]MDR4306290.1 DUF47 domain-containing protein [Chelatococcus sambhunathii]